MNLDKKEIAESSKNHSTQAEEMEAIQEKKESTEKTIRATTENLEDLGAEISLNTAENLSSLNLEELYNKSEELNSENQSISDSKIKTSYNITGLKAYLNMNLDEKEESDTREKISKYQKELEDLDNKLNQNKKILKSIESEIETRSTEINTLFTKLFDSIQSADAGFLDGITSTVVKEDGKEIGKEISIAKLFGKQCLFRDNDGIFYITLPGNKDHRESVSIRTVYSFLRKISDSIEHNGESQKISDTIELNENDYEVNEIDIINDLIGKVDYYGIDKETVYEYINIIKKHDKISRHLDENLKKILGFDNIESDITIKDGCALFYVKKSCPNRYREILPLVHNMMGSNEYIVEQYGILRRTILSIKKFGDSAYEYLKFCSPFEGSYMKEGISHIQGKYFGETLDQMKQRYEKDFGDLSTMSNLNEKINYSQNQLTNTSMLVQYIESFDQEPESLNLFSFIKDYPQKLKDLGGKEIKSIDLSIDSGINFAFRGILEMVKSRSDINFPHFSEDMSESEKKEWRLQREKIIHEYETMLRNYISKDKQENSEDNKKTFDKIFVSLSQGDMGFDNKDSDFMPSKERAQQFSGSEVSDYSDEENAYSIGKTKEIKMISDIEKYVKDHPDEKILVCVNHHGASDGASSNGWTKKDWLRLANISPNIKIWSIRCYFGTAFSNRDIYGQQSSVSGFSNNTVTSASIGEIITDASNKNLGFNEMEIYTRLNYPISASPLTESMEYTNWNTGKTEIGKIGLAQNDSGQNEDLDNNYT